MELIAEKDIPTDHNDFSSPPTADPSPPLLIQSTTILHVEVRLLPSADSRLDSVTRWVHEWLHANFISLSLAQDISCFGIYHTLE